MTARPSDLPGFEAPPVVEVALGASFATAERLRIYHIGLYREIIKADFPAFQEQPPWPAADEPAFVFMQGPPPLPRCWFLNGAGTRLIQLQPDRFVHNWRKVSGEDEYPRYEGIRDEFLRRWEQFQGFAEEQDLGRLSLLGLELTYVNHILKDMCWSEPRETGTLFRFLSEGLGSLVAGDVDTVTCQLRYKLLGDHGHLHVALTPAIRVSDQKELLRFDLSVRGPVASSERAQVLAWFDSAREAVVRAFDSLTTEKAHRAWRKKG